MIDEAKGISQEYERYRRRAMGVLEEACKTGNLMYALEVFVTLRNVLPRSRWQPDKQHYPLFREHLNDRGLERHETVDVIPCLEERIHVVTHALVNDPLYTPETVKILWEIVNGGHVSFKWDW